MGINILNKEQADRLFPKLENAEDNFELMVEIFKPLQSNVLYHYTTVDSFVNIIRSKSLWMMDLSSMEDKKELNYPLHTFINDINDLVNEETDERIKIALKVALKSTEESFEKINLLSEEIDKAYALCLAKRPDSRFHWLTYANNGQGICIGIDTSAIDNFFKINVNARPIGTLEMDNVVYNKKDRQGLIHKLLKEWIDIGTELDITVVCVVYRMMKRFVKRRKYAREHEFRIYHDGQSIPSVAPLIFNRLFQYSPNELIKKAVTFLKDFGLMQESETCAPNGRYYKPMLLKPIWDERLIPEVKLGTDCKLSTSEIRMLLDENGLIGTKII